MNTTLRLIEIKTNCNQKRNCEKNMISSVNWNKFYV